MYQVQNGQNSRYRVVDVKFSASVTGAIITSIGMSVAPTCLENNNHGEIVQGLLSSDPPTANLACFASAVIQM